MTATSRGFTCDTRGRRRPWYSMSKEVCAGVCSAAHVLQPLQKSSAATAALPAAQIISQEFSPQRLARPACWCIAGADRDSTTRASSCRRGRASDQFGIACGVGYITPHLLYVAHAACARARRKHALLTLASKSSACTYARHWQTLVEPAWSVSHAALVLRTTAVTVNALQQRLRVN